MNVKLISYSQAPQDWDYGDNVQELIAFCARVSNPSNQMNNETSEKLIKYLIKHAHWSPLEMVSACSDKAFSFGVKECPPVAMPVSNVLMDSMRIITIFGKGSCPLAAFRGIASKGY